MAEASISDGHVMTVLVRARDDIGTLTAEVEGPGCAPVVSTLLRYRRDGQAHLLASLTFAQPVQPGTIIRLRTESGEVSAQGAEIRSTRDKTYPLIDRLVLGVTPRGLCISEGRPRIIDSPAVTGVAWSQEQGGIRVATDSRLSGARLHVRESGDHLPLPCSGSELLLPTDVLAGVCPVTSDGPVLLGLAVMSEDGSERPLVHRDPWVRIPRNYQTFTPIALPIPGGKITVRPYWTRSGTLALKVRSH